MVKFFLQYVFFAEKPSLLVDIKEQEEEQKQGKIK